TGFLVARFNVDGTPDTSFGTNGQVINNFLPGLTDGAFAVVVQSDGKIVAGGTTGGDGGPGDFDHVALARYNSNGSLDTTFGSNGFVGNDLNTVTVTDLALQSDGKIIVGISNYIGRYNSNGTLDTTFAPSSSTPGFVVFSTGAIGRMFTLQTDG